jgi:hypothetical protein
MARPSVDGTLNMTSIPPYKHNAIVDEHSLHAPGQPMHRLTHIYWSHAVYVPKPLVLM